MMDDNSSSTSCDDKSDFNENPTRDALADGLMSFLKPRVDNLNKVFDTVKKSQEDLLSELTLTHTDLEKIVQEKDGTTEDFQKYTEQIVEMKQQMTVIENVLQSARSRLQNFTGMIQELQKSRKPHFDSFSAPKENS